MPIYEFVCQDCRENFDKLVRIAGEQQVVCPYCGSAQTRKKISLFASKTKGGGAFSNGGGSDCAPGGT